MTDLRFRRARFEDLDPILRLLVEDHIAAVRETTDRSAYEGPLKELCASDDHMFWVAERHGQVVGCCQIIIFPGLSRRGARRGHIESVFVAGALRGQGIGAAMMAEAEAVCRARGCTLIQLMSDKARIDAHRFYERLGYVASHEGMKKPL